MINYCDRHEKQFLDFFLSFVGKKNFLFGDKVSEFDCTVFAMIAQLWWQTAGSPLREHIKGNWNIIYINKNYRIF